MLSTAGGIVSGVAVGLYPLARLTPRMGRERGWRQAVQRLPQLSIALWMIERPWAAGSAQA